MAAIVDVYTSKYRTPFNAHARAVLSFHLLEKKQTCLLFGPFHLRWKKFSSLPADLEKSFHILETKPQSMPPLSLRNIFGHKGKIELNS